MKDNFSLPVLAWPLLVLVCTIFILYGLYQALQKTGWQQQQKRKLLTGVVVVMVVWMALLTILSLRGFFADFSQLPPRPGLAILLPLPVVLIFAFSKKGTQLLRMVPPQWLVLLQSFRVVVELLLLAAFLSNKLPVQMTFEGRNFDVLTGVLALPVGYFCFIKKRWPSSLAVAFNIVGLLLLLNILIVAVLSMPTPMRYFMNEPANTLVAQFPYIYLPGILVPLAYSLHIFSLRQLLLRRKAVVSGE